MLYLEKPLEVIEVIKIDQQAWEKAFKRESPSCDYCKDKAVGIWQDTYFCSQHIPEEIRKFIDKIDHRSANEAEVTLSKV